MSEFPVTFNPLADFERATAKAHVVDSPDDPAWLQLARRVGLRTSTRGYATGRRPTSWVGLSFKANDVAAIHLLHFVGKNPDLVAVKNDVETFIWFWKPLYYVSDLQASFDDALAECETKVRLVATGFDLDGCRFLDPVAPLLDGPEFVPSTLTFTTDLKQVIPFKKVTGLNQVNLRRAKLVRKGITNGDAPPDPTPFKYVKGKMSAATVQDILVKKFNDVLRDEPCASRARKVFIQWGSWKFYMANKKSVLGLGFSGCFDPDHFEATLGNFFDTMLEWRKRPAGRSTPYLSLFPQDSPFVALIEDYVRSSQEFQNFKGRTTESPQAAQRRLLVFIRKVLDAYLLQIFINPSWSKLVLPSAYLKRLDSNYGPLMAIFESLFVQRDGSYCNATIGYFCKSTAVKSFIDALYLVISRSRESLNNVNSQELKQEGQDEEKSKIRKESDSEKFLVVINVVYSHIATGLRNSDMYLKKGETFLKALLELEVTPRKMPSVGVDFREFTLGSWVGRFLGPHFPKMPRNTILLWS